MHHICICVCTYKRPILLGKLLAKLERQATEDLFGYSIVVADNDKFESARHAAESFAEGSNISIRYCVEPVQNIALARNKVIENAAGDFVAFIDDDEFPQDQWLLNHYRALNRYNSDGVLGPVLPLFEVKPPGWVLEGGFFDRPTHTTGFVLDWPNTRTGNALLKMQVFEYDSMWFDPAYGSGGEDRDFFRRKIERGNVFVWCNEAPVFEVVPPHRWDRRILLKRALLRGKMALNEAGSRPLSVLRSTAVIAFYAGCLPLFFVLSHFVFMKYFIKSFDHLGKVLGFLGADLVKEKYVGF
ncbi:MAG: glycosyltransferase family 2 protein [Syntrophobacteraceae bacterium]|jgi:glycosyltransferase involved in cell wall biosynthesis